MAIKPLLKYAHRIPTDVEVAFIWIGQSNALPNGTKAELFSIAPLLSRGKVGLAVTGITIPAGTGTETLTGFSGLIANEWNGEEFRPGTPSAPLVGRATVVSNTTTTVTVTWLKNATAGAGIAGYLTRRSGKFASYESVRVLTPHQPDQDGAYPTSPVAIPGFTVPPGVTGYSDAGVFLPFTFLEGIEGFGVSNTGTGANAGGAATGAAPTTFSFTTGITAGILAGGYLRVEHDGGVSWADITDNGANSFTGLTWQGAGQPSGATPANWSWEAWLPHFDNNPYHQIPGKGFRQPSNNPQPAGKLKNRPRSNTTAIYGDQAGAMLQFGWDMSLRLGRRVNMIPLAAGGAGMFLAPAWNPAGYQGTWGWWDYRKHRDWTPSNPDGLYTRLNRLITVIAPGALVAEGSTKRLMIFGIVNFHGEEESGSSLARADYSQSLPALYAAIRTSIKTANLSPYNDPARTPVFHPEITDVPWGASDPDGDVNTAIRKFVASDGYAATHDLNASPKKAGDTAHFNGVGEGTNGHLAADDMVLTMDLALSQGFDEGAVDIANLALSHIGNETIVSLDTETDKSTAAALCSRFYGVARDAILEMRPWSFALRRAALPIVEVDAESPTTAWKFAYGVPPDALSVFAVTPPDASGDFTQAFTQPDGTQIAVPGYVPQDFVVELDAFGNRILYTNQENAHARYVARIADAAAYPSLFKVALSWKLASMVAGPLIKGEPGSTEAKRCLAMLATFLPEAASLTANQRQVRVESSQNPWGR